MVHDSGRKASFTEMMSPEWGIAIAIFDDHNSKARWEWYAWAMAQEPWGGARQ